MIYTYKFSEDTKEFLYKEEAFLDPLESELQETEIYLLPADSTFTPCELKEKDKHAIVWNGSEWIYVEDHRQKRDTGGVVIEGTGTPYWMEEDTYESQPRYMTTLGSLPDNALLTKPEKPIELLIKESRSKVDSYTHGAIIRGFDYTINGEQLHFSYDIEDQQNFSDTYNAISMKKLMGVQNLPDTIEWNGWRNYVSSESKGELVVLTLDADLFIELYTQGAFVHKQTFLEIGKQRKKLIEGCTTKEELNNLLVEWNLA